MKKLVPHILIVLSVVMLVFLIIDQMNSAMGFIDNQATKIIMMIQSGLTLVFALWFGFRNDK